MSAKKRKSGTMQAGVRAPSLASFIQPKPQISNYSGEERWELTPEHNLLLAVIDRAIKDAAATEATTTHKIRLEALNWLEFPGSAEEPMSLAWIANHFPIDADLFVLRCLKQVLVQEKAAKQRRLELSDVYLKKQQTNGVSQLTIFEAEVEEKCTSRLERMSVRLSELMDCHIQKSEN